MAEVGSKANGNLRIMWKNEPSTCMLFVVTAGNVCISARQRCTVLIFGFIPVYSVSFPILVRLLTTFRRYPHVCSVICFRSLTRIHNYCLSSFRDYWRALSDYWRAVRYYWRARECCHRLSEKARRAIHSPNLGGGEEGEQNGEGRGWGTRFSWSLHFTCLKT